MPACGKSVIEPAWCRDGGARSRSSSARRVLTCSAVLPYLGLAAAATTALELHARAAYGKRRDLPPAAYGTYWRPLLRWT